MTLDEKFMQRCLALASNGLGFTYPNPMVGCVIVHAQIIIGEGWHQKAGEPHSEVMAVKSVEDKSLLPNSTLYVNLEPCNHFGRTPPCSQLILEHKIPRVVIGTTDPFKEVNGSGIRTLENHGVKVELSTLSDSCQALNKRFFTFHRKKRPYIILKWAQTANGLFAPQTAKQKWISGKKAKQLSHKWRTEEAAILVGKRTALIDNPSLTAREWHGKNPARILIDNKLEVSQEHNLYNRTSKLLVFNSLKSRETSTHTFIRLDFGLNILHQMMNALYSRDIQSVIVEGGAATLESFITNNLWDEARIFTSPTNWETGIAAPKIYGDLVEKRRIDSDWLSIYKNPQAL